MTDSFPLVDVISARPREGQVLSLTFSTGEIGEISLAKMIETGGPMVEPLRDPAVFAQVFVELGAPAWPHGFDLDAIALYIDMRDRGLLRKPAA
ncbi:DUF2442 domain-containing protein [Hoeflea olei]|uniref:DUF2442 domain-containing protein n=1 Tax=Hoeflea olei TaxID=1480615 RepID=A0A1C1YV68_9HYPH|nr:DUF2442 domain-containing protein [Hoeflea olei]OCW57240.1 hypothetical protein AWJ14_13070 [Hoeflea olei]